MKGNLMNKRKMLLASFGALSLAVVVPAGAAGPGAMSPAVAVSPQRNAALLTQLDARRAARGLDARYGYAIVARHPGAQGTQVARVAHTYKGVRIFGFDSVLVLDANGRIVSESDSEQRANFVKADTAGPGTEFSVVPAISSKAAIDAALASLGTSARHETPPSAELIIWPRCAPNASRTRATSRNRT
jgi:zinc metalloprotease ZmpA